MNKPLLTLLALALVVWIYTLHLMGADGQLSNQGGTTTTGGGGSASVIFTNNQVSVSVSSSGIFTLTNYAAAGLGLSWSTNGNETVSGTITSTTTGSALTMANTAYITGGGYRFYPANNSSNMEIRNSDGSTLYIQVSGSSGALRSVFGIISDTTSTATNGFASFASDAGVALTATGLTNALGKNAMAYVTATAIAFTIKNAANTTLYTSPTLTATISVQLHPGWSVNAASGLSGTLLPE